ncbi:MAG TPA: MFS transporter [Ktedonobacteraceae bacterium]
MSQTDQPESSFSSSSTLSTPTDLILKRHDPYQALRYRDFRFYFLAAFLSATGEQMLSVAIGWELYQRTNSAFALGMVGLVQVLPVMALSLFTGSLADRVNRKRMMLAAQSLFVVSALGLTVLSYLQGPILLIYSCLLLNGIAASFSGPVTSALLSQTVPENAYENAATWESSSWQLASVGGPALGGLLIALFHRATPIYMINVGAISIAILCVSLLRADYRPRKRLANGEKVSTLRSLAEGLRFLRGTQVILAAITLDLFAVLLGGATTLMPIFARDILRVGPTGLGLLQAAPSVGALCMTLLMAHTPPFKKAGRTLLLAVGTFGLVTCIFGLSHLFWLSLLSLALLGAMDNVSVVIRSTLLLTRPPDEMRGRVASVNALFISMSNQLGGFESGMAAQLFGPLAAVVGGGLGTILVVVLVAMCWPEMRRLGTLIEAKQEQAV